PRFGEQPQLQLELGAPGERGGERGALELLRDDRRHEGRLPARQRPEVVDHRLHAAPFRLDDLEVGAVPGELAEPRPDSGIRAAAGDVDGAEVVARAISRAYQSASRSAAPAASTKRTTWFVAGGAAATAEMPARRRRQPCGSGG